MCGDILVLFKSGRFRLIKDCLSFVYLPTLQSWSIATFSVPSHELLFKDSSVLVINWFKEYYINDFDFICDENNISDYIERRSKWEEK